MIDEDHRRTILASRSSADVGQAILPASGLSSPPGGLKGRMQPGLAAPRSVFNRADPDTQLREIERGLTDRLRGQNL